MLRTSETTLLTRLTRSRSVECTKYFTSPRAGWHVITAGESYDAALLRRHWHEHLRLRDLGVPNRCLRVLCYLYETGLACSNKRHAREDGSSILKLQVVFTSAIQYCCKGNRLNTSHGTVPRPPFKRGLSPLRCDHHPRPLQAGLDFVDEPVMNNHGACR